MDERDFDREREKALDALISLVADDPRVDGLWLQGSLARGDADQLSDIDAYLSVKDEALNEVFAERSSIVSSIQRPIAWSDGATPGLKCVHALLEGGVRLDLFFEAASTVSNQKRPVARILVDKGRLAASLALGWEAPVDLIGHIVGVIVRMTRQGGTWPLRTLRRGQWSTFAMMELDLINAQIAQLMAVQLDPANFYQNPFSLYRRLKPPQQALLDSLTDEALAGLAKRDTAALLAVHLKVLDSLMNEGRAACAALGVPYPISPEGDESLKALLAAGWPK
jgi:predicted nucleotidyltransferase